MYSNKRKSLSLLHTNRCLPNPVKIKHSAINRVISIVNYVLCLCSPTNAASKLFPLGLQHLDIFSARRKLFISLRPYTAIISAASNPCDGFRPATPRVGHSRVRNSQGPQLPGSATPKVRHKAYLYIRYPNISATYPSSKSTNTYSTS